MNLFLIGNGFDLAHGFKTSFNDFGSYVKNSKKPNEKKFLTRYKTLVAPRDSWGDFEDNLGVVPESFCEDANGLDMLGGFWKGLNIKELASLINQCLLDWVRSIDINGNSIFKFQERIKEENRYISFNYTNTLEDIYKIPAKYIWHIHNYFIDEYMNDILNLKKNPKLIVGCANNIKFNIDVDEDTKTTYNKYISKHPEKIFDDDGKGLLEELQKKNVENIYVYGMSIDKADEYYFKKLKTMFPNAIWHSTFYGNKEELSNKFESLGIEVSFDLELK